MTPVRYEVVGQEEYALTVSIDAQGEFTVSSGTYTTDRPRHGMLGAQQQQELTAAIEALGIPQEHPLPEGADAFLATLTVGEGEHAVNYPFWEGALEQDAALNRVVRLIEMI